MHHIEKSTIPSGLAEYVRTHPVGTPEHRWAVFCADTRAKKEVQWRLFEDQHGLCAFCEIGLDEPGAGCEGDFHVEHFHPRSDGSTPKKGGAWELDWKNLFACCQGGNEPHVRDETRYSAEKANWHCDAPKENKNLDGIILNPIEIPATPCLFAETADVPEDELRLEPDAEACGTVSGDCFIRAQKTLEELRLNCKLLSRRRRAALDAVYADIEETMEKCQDQPDPFACALRLVLEAVFPPGNVSWGPFPTAIRAHFGECAEMRLKEIGYGR